MKLISLFLCLINCTFGLKLEKWHHPDIEGSIQPEALSTALRNPKIFFGVSEMLFRNNLHPFLTLEFDF